VNWDEFENDVVDMTRGVFTDLQQAHPDEHFYAFALYSDGDGITICPAANSREGLARAFARDEVDPDGEDWAYYTWDTAEWTYEAPDSDRLRDICAALREAAEDSEPEAFVEQVVQVMIRTLGRLRDEGVFRPDGVAGAPTLFVSISDDHRAETIEAASAQALNDPAVFAGFTSRHVAAR
jgi:hypothetical protein